MKRISKKLIGKEKESNMKANKLQNQISAPNQTKCDFEARLKETLEGICIPSKMKKLKTNGNETKMKGHQRKMMKNEWK